MININVSLIVCSVCVKIWIYFLKLSNVFLRNFFVQTIVQLPLYHILRTLHRNYTLHLCILHNCCLSTPSEANVIFLFKWKCRTFRIITWNEIKIYLEILWICARLIHFNFHYNSWCISDAPVA